MKNKCIFIRGNEITVNNEGEIKYLSPVVRNEHVDILLTNYVFADKEDQNSIRSSFQIEEVIITAQKNDKDETIWNFKTTDKDIFVNNYEITLRNKNDETKLYPVIKDGYVDILISNNVIDNEGNLTFKYEVKNGFATDQVIIKALKEETGIVWYFALK